jgi:uncharacterized OB-fold protein
MSDELRPWPLPDADSAAFWQAAKEGELRLPRCAKCGRLIFYPRSVCPSCMSRDLSWESLSGAATIYSYAVVHKAPPGFTDDVPYVVALVDLAEGARMMTRIVDCEISDVHIDMAVSVVFRDFGHEWPLPCFTQALPLS